MVFIVIISSILLAVCTSLKPIYLQNAIDAADAGTDGALAMFLCYAASILGILLFETARQLSTGKYRNSRLFSLKRKVMAHIVYMPPRKFQEEQGQNYVTTLNNEIEMLVDSYYVTRLELAYSILVLVTCVIALLYINGYLAMIIIVSTVCPIVASAVQGKALEKRTNFYTMALEKLNVMIGNLIHGYPTIKVNHVEREYLQTLEQDVACRQAAKRVLVVTGSQKKETAAQVRRLEAVCGLHKVLLDSARLLHEPAPEEISHAAQRLTELLRREDGAILAFDSLFCSQTGFAGDDVAARKVGKSLAAKLGEVLERTDHTLYDGLILVGGDTAVAVCRSLHTTQLLLLEEVQSGTPAGLLADGPLRGIPVVTKSGAFGDEDTLLHAWKYIRREGE